MAFGSFYIHVSNCTQIHGGVCTTDCGSAACGSGSNSYWGIWPNWGAACGNGHTASAYCRSGHGENNHQEGVVAELAGCGDYFVVGGACATSNSIAWIGPIKSCGPSEIKYTADGGIYCSPSGSHHLVASINPAWADQIGGWHGYGHRWASVSPA